jgi:FAD/FMN-containing dehydrogenase
MWDSPDMDAANTAWHERCVELLKPHVAGHYVAESDTVAHPEYSRLSFTSNNWARLNDLRAKHDPDGLFFDFSDELQDT